MLVKFTVGNFLSFRDKETLSLVASSISEYRNDNVVQTSLKNTSLLKGAVLYGANSSGKSNLFKALNFAQWLILNSSKNVQVGEELDVEPFMLSTETINKPSFFEIEFIFEGHKYRYGFKVDRIKIHEEWLYCQKKIKEYLLFERNNNNIITSNSYRYDENLIEKTRENALVLSVSAQFNISLAIELIKKIRQINFISGTRDHYSYQRTVSLLEKPDYRNRILDFIKGANLGFQEIKTKKVTVTEDMLEGIPEEIQKIILKDHDEEVTVNTGHTVYNEEGVPVDKVYFDLQKNESLGSQKYFSLSGPIIEALTEGLTLIIDEFDARMHPILSKEIVCLFNSKKNNPNKAQLIFATHNTTLLSSEVFRRDQVVLLKKNKIGSTQLNTLYDLKIRKDASFEKDYFLGRYEGVPITALSSQLNLFDDQPTND